MREGDARSHESSPDSGARRSPLRDPQGAKDGPRGADGGATLSRPEPPTDDRIKLTREAGLARGGGAVPVPVFERYNRSTSWEAAPEAYVRGGGAAAGLEDASSVAGEVRAGGACDLSLRRGTRGGARRVGLTGMLQWRGGDRLIATMQTFVA